MIETSGVVVEFDAVVALAGVDLAVQEGEVHGLLGPNGSGKTTLVKVIATLLAPTAGAAFVHGTDVQSNPTRVRQSIGLAGQSAAVDDLLTGRENLEFVGRLYGLPAKEARRRAGMVLERLSLTQVKDRRVGTYSGGMRRRLDLGASLVGRPRVLLLDEPTTGLDPRTRLELWDFLRELVDEGTTVLLTTQYLEEADALADRITVIDHGSVIAEGTADELKESIGNSLLVVTPRDRDDLARTADAISGLGSPFVKIDQHNAVVTMPVSDRVTELLRAAALVHADGIELADIGVQRPSLDDVFLNITSTTTAGQTRTPTGAAK